MPSGNDMFELKLRKKLLAQQLSVLDDKVDRMARILDKKITLKGLPSSAKNDVKEERKKTSYRQQDITVYKKLMEPRPIEPGSDFDQVRKRNVLRHKQAMMNRKPRAKVEVAKVDAFKINANVPASLLPRRYTRGELPCTVEHRSSGLALSWMCPLHNLDYEHYLPIFMDGVRCTDNPHKFIARQGVYELIEDARGNSQRVIDCLLLLMLPLRYSLSTKNPDTILAVINILKQLCDVHPTIGPHLIPHYRQILGILNLFYGKGGKNLGDAMDYKQFNSDDLVVPIAECLEALERTGGPNAFVNIKFMVPTYTSAFAN
jgi:hypothetical protein